MLSWILAIYPALRQVNDPRFRLWKTMYCYIWHICQQCRSTLLCNGCGRGGCIRDPHADSPAGDSAQADLQFECVTPRERRCGR
jgi:hypothetical protein